jgi:hypothetical protein
MLSGPPPRPRSTLSSGDASTTGKKSPNPWSVNPTATDALTHPREEVQRVYQHDNGASRKDDSIRNTIKNHGAPQRISKGDRTGSFRDTLRRYERGGKEDKYSEKRLEQPTHGAPPIPYECIEEATVVPSQELRGTLAI